METVSKRSVLTVLDDAEAGPVIPERSRFLGSKFEVRGSEFEVRDSKTRE
jgi:hypothetical protein